MGFALHRGVPISPKIAPAPYPNINNSPLVVAGAIGNVNSDAKFIDTGIIGTKKTPKSNKQNPTKYTFNVGSTIITIIPIITTITHITLSEIKNFYFFCSTTATTKLDITPKTAVIPP